MRGKRLFAALLTLFALMPALVSCKPAEFVISAPTPPDTTAVVSLGAMEDEAELRLAMPASESSIDPYSVTSYKTQSLLNLVYETPFILGSDGEPQPYLFESWELNDDGSVTFSIRKNVRFHDGEALTCAHIAENLRKIRLAGASSPYSYVMRDVESWQLSSDGVKITLVPQRGVFSMFMSLTFPVTNGAENCGTGPYRVSAWHEGEGLQLVQSDVWWRKPPKIETIHIVSANDDGEQLQSLLSGGIDFMVTRSDNLASYRNSKKYENSFVRSDNFEFISMNLVSGFMADEAFRQAFSFALDRKDIISTVYQSAAVLADQPVPVDSWLHDFSAASLEFDKEKAIALLAGLGFKDSDGDGYLDAPAAQDDASAEEILPLTLRLITNSETSASIHRDAARRIERQMRAVGIKVVIDALPMKDLKKALENGDYDLAYLGTVVTADVHLEDFYGENGALNFGGYFSEEMEGLLSERAKARTRQELLSATSAAQRLATVDMPIIGVCYKYSTMFFSEKLTGIGSVGWKNVFANIDEWVFKADE